MEGAPPQNLRFGRYEALFRIGIGGMAEVYAARIVGEAGFEKLVAVKRMLPHLSHDDRFLQMFLDEARLAANVQSPHVAQTFDLGRANDDSLYLVMELVVGVNLTHILVYLHEQMQFIDPFLGAEIIAQAAQGLDDAHEARTPAGQELRMVHRDVSPQNIMVGVDGRARVTDFGIAKAIHLRTTETQAGEKKGKYSYFSPEQAFGKPVDRRSDVFALGVVAWEFLLGRRLFPGTPLEAMEAIRDKPIPVPHELRPELGEELSQVILDALVRDPEKRIQSCLQFSRRIRKALNKLDEPPSPRDIGNFVEQSGGQWLLQMRDAIASAARGKGLSMQPDVRVPDATTAWSELSPDEDVKLRGKHSTTAAHEAVTRGIPLDDDEPAEDSLRDRKTDPPAVPSNETSSVQRTGESGRHEGIQLAERETSELPAIAKPVAADARAHQLPEQPESEISASDAPTEAHVRPEFAPEHRDQDKRDSRPDDAYSGEDTAPVVSAASSIKAPQKPQKPQKEGPGEQTKAEMLRFMPRDETARRNVLVGSMLALPVLLLGAFAIFASAGSALEVQDTPFPGVVAKEASALSDTPPTPSLPDPGKLETAENDTTEAPVPVEAIDVPAEELDVPAEEDALEEGDDVDDVEESDTRERHSPRRRRIRVRSTPRSADQTKNEPDPAKTTTKQTKPTKETGAAKTQLPSTDRWQ